MLEHFNLRNVLSANKFSVMSVDTVPSALRNLRACLLCSLVKVSYYMGLMNARKKLCVPPVIYAIVLIFLIPLTIV